MDGFLNLAWLVPIPPFVAFLLIILFLNGNKRVSSLTAILGVVISMAIGWPIAFAAFTASHFGEQPVEGQLFQIPAGASAISIGYQVDPANALMLFMVCVLLLLLFGYSAGYMTFPPHLPK